MTIQLSYGNQVETRKRLLDFLTRHRKARGIKVLDVGGSRFGWSKPVIDMICDIKADPSDSNAFVYNICEEESWRKLIEFCETNGKFDFVICTHTLEDLYNPYPTLSNIHKVARAGLISMPSVWTELSHVESSQWLGYFHHRWVFDWDFEKNCMLLVPKLECLSAFLPKGLGYLQSDLSEVIFEFDGEFRFETFMDNYLGPTSAVALGSYREFIETRFERWKSCSPYQPVYKS